VRQKAFAIGIVGLSAALAISIPAHTQGNRTAAVNTATGNAGYTNTVFDKLNIGPGGPAPKRELTGVWAGPIAARAGEAPSLTLFGKQLQSLNKPEAQYKVSGTNDPYVRTCDPLGFPRNLIFETRGIAFSAMADRIIVMSQYQRVWREIWTDGRELPKNAGQRGGPDSRYYGYSVGHWEDDNTLVVDTVGLDPSTWLSNEGFPHTSDARIQERWVRKDHNDLGVTVTVDDPKVYATPFRLGSNNFKWIPDQQFDEQLCVPSQVLDYLKYVGDPAR
jgi:hypothetical protein